MTSKGKQPNEEHPATDEPRPVDQSAAAESTTPALPHDPKAAPGAVDIVGAVPPDVHVEEDITEGHPGYEESGRSEVIPPQRFADKKRRSKPADEK